MIDITAIVKPLRFTFTEIWTYKDDFERRSLKDNYTEPNFLLEFRKKIVVVYRAFIL